MAEILVDDLNDDFELVADDAAPEDVKYSDGWSEHEVEEEATELLAAIKQVETDSEAKRAREAKWRRQARGEPSVLVKNYPMPNSANITPPLAMIHAQTMAAEIINYFSVDPFWTFKSFNSEDAKLIEDGKLLTKYFSILARSESDLALKSKLRTIGNETALIGKIPLRIPYYVNSYRVKDELGSSSDIQIHDGPTIDCLKQIDCFYPEGWESFEEMPWVATRFRISEYDLMAKKARGEWENIDKVIGGTSDELSVKREDGRGEKHIDEAYEFYEVCFYHDVDQDGFCEDHVWIIHESGIVMKRSLNTLGMRPYAIAFFNKDSHELEGKGTGQICEMPQDEVEALHNLRLDNMKIVNMRMFEITRATAMSNDEDVYPGKGWIVDKIGSIAPIQFGEIYPSTMNEENNIWHITAQATSMSEVKRGFSDPNLGQRDTFRGQQMRLNQSKGIFGTIVDGLTECFNRVGLLVFIQLQANRERVIARERELGRLTQPEIDRLEAIFAHDSYANPSGFPFQIVTGAVESQQGAELQALQMGAQLYAQWAQQTSPLAQMVLGPQAAQLQQQAPDVYRHFASVYVGSTKFLERTLKLAGISDYSLFTPDVSKLSYVVELMDKEQENQVKVMEAQSGIPRSGPSPAEQFGGQAPVSGGYAQGLPNAPAQGAGQGAQGAGGGAQGPVQGQGA